jgi:hypothetical protein
MQSADKSILPLQQRFFTATTSPTHFDEVDTIQRSFDACVS